MSMRRLGTEHYIAINFLSLPKHGGMTMQEIADEAGVSRQTLYNWLDDRMFDSELKKRIIRNSRRRVPELVESMADHAISDGNAALSKLLLQMHDMLTDPVSVGDKLDSAGNMEDMQERIDAYRKQAKDAVKQEGE